MNFVRGRARSASNAPPLTYWLGCSVVVVGCSSRASTSSTYDAPPSCESLVAEAEREAPHQLTAVTDSMWLVAEPKSPQPLVVNWADARIAGQPALWRSEGGRHWLVSDAYALSLDAASRSRVEGRMLACGRGEVNTGARDANSAAPYDATPLAPRVAARRGELTLVARFPDAATPWPDSRTSDLARFGETFVAVARGPDGLRLLEFRPESSALVETSHLATVTDDDFNDVVAIDERYLAVASRRFGLVIVDVSDPALPHVVADGLPLIRPRDGHSVAIAEGRVYLAQAPAVGTGAVVAFDVTNPERPREVWRWDAPSGEDAHDITVFGDAVYVSSLRGGITLLDVTRDLPRVAARRRGLAAHSASFIDAARERLLWSEEQVGGSLHVVDVVREAGGIELRDVRLAATYVAGAFDAGGAAVPFAASPHLTTCRDGVCFVAHYQLGLVVLDLRGEPSLPVLDSARIFGTYPTWSPTPRAESTWLRGAVGVEVDGPFVYVADTELGLAVLRAPTWPAAQQRQSQ